MREKTCFILKPDALKRGLESKIFAYLESSGLKVAQRKNLTLTPQLATELYQPHLGKKFYPGLLKFITSGPVICAAVEGEDAIAKLRELMGSTDPRQAEAGTIRGDLKEENVLTEDGIIKNLVHGSDSPESAEREINIFFGKTPE